MLSLSFFRYSARYSAGGNAAHGAPGFDGIDYYRVRAHGRVVADVDADKNLRTSAEHDVVPDVGAQPRVKTHIQFPGAERDALKDGHIAADAPRSNHGARRVREKNPRPD